MYRTCLFCTRPLGANPVVEHFPVGKRLAFDAAKGRLWVVCGKCERWNLVPVVERWEAIEELERAYADLTIRFSTEHIGVARHPGGLDLVRVGKPKRPEFAAWRYGDQFGRRRRRWWTGGGLAAAAAGSGVAVALTSASAASVLGIYALMVAYSFFPLFANGLGHSPMVVRLADGRLKGLFRSKARSCLIVPHEAMPGWAIRVPEVRYDPEDVYRPKITLTEFTGDDARIVASRMIPAANRFGAGDGTVQRAVGLVEEAGSADAAVLALTADIPRIGSLARPQRLALEMALHEETERRALEGELAALEQQWRAAEELAAISDALLVPDEVARKLERLKRGEAPSDEA